MAGLSISEAYPCNHSSVNLGLGARVSDRRANTHLEDTEQLLHVGPFGFQQLVHDVSADREGRDQV